MSFVIRLPLLLSAAVLLAAGCTRAPEPDRRPLRTVTQRLGADAFGLAPAPRAVAQIGEEARPVVVAPTVVLAGDAQAVRMVDGKVRAEIALAPAAAALPDGALTLSYQTIPEVVAHLPAAAAGFAMDRSFQVASGGFTIARTPDDRSRVIVELTPERPLDSSVVNLRLHGILPIRAALESAPFTMPAGGRLELGYGLAQHAGSVAQPRVAFRAVASCDGAADAVLADAVLVDATIAGGEAGARTWHDVTHDLPAPAQCRLRLESRSLTDDDVRGAVWAVPRVVAPLAGEPPAIRNVVVISLDTLRADHLSGYGYGRDTSPRIDEALIARGVRFADASTTFPRTDVAHLSLFSGLTHDAQATLGRLEPGSRAKLLAESLRDAGFETAAYTEDALVAGSFGFWFGFDRFVERAFVERGRGVATFADGARHLAANPDRRSFLFLHTYKTHDPYVSDARSHALFTDPGDPATGFHRRIPPAHRAEVDAYDRTIREADELLGGFLDELERQGLAASTLVVLLSDHGEAFGEHAVARHGTAFHQEQLHVPLVFRGPGIPEDETIDTPVSLVDVAPTILDLLGLAPLPQGMGISLAGALAGDDLEPDRPIFFGWMSNDDRMGMRLGSVKLIDAGGRLALYDLTADPDEVAPRQPGADEVAPLAARLARHREEAAATRSRTAAPDTDGGAAPIPERVEESLRALGYL